MRVDEEMQEYPRRLKHFMSFCAYFVFSELRPITGTQLGISYVWHASLLIVLTLRHQTSIGFVPAVFSLAQTRLRRVRRIQFRQRDLYGMFKLDVSSSQNNLVSRV